MAIVGTHLLTADTGTGATSFVTASISPTSGKLILAAIFNSVATVGTPTLTGNSLTWVQIATQVDGATNTRRCTLFRAMGTASAGAITIDFAGASQNNCGWSISEFSGIDLGGTNGSSAIVQSTSDFSVASSTTFTLTLGAFSSDKNATYGCLRLGGTANSLVVGSGFTELGQSATAATGESEWKATNDTSVDWSFTSTTNTRTGIAIEIKAAGSGGLTLSGVG